MNQVRYPAVAGQFYPGEAMRLKQNVVSYIEESGEVNDPIPKAVIAPHAGYVYSGPIAGTAYSYLATADGSIRRVVLLGPAHWVVLRGLATSGVEAFATPLGNVPLDLEAERSLASLPQVSASGEAHRREHSLEVQLPFLQAILEEFEVVPLVVGDAAASEVGEVLDLIWGGPETVIVISSDLSHYHDYETARRLDRETSERIEALQDLSEGQACGRKAINGLLFAARERGMKVKTADLRNSGDTAGPRDRVVGYGAYVFWE